MATHPNIIQVERVATALAHLRERVVFIGGSIVGLLITDPGSPEPRKTKDVDLIIEVAGLSAHAQMDAELRSLGFQHDITEKGHMLRWRLNDLIVDMLPPNGTSFGMKTDWYPEALECPTSYKLEDGKAIKLISSPLFLCTKFHAFADRGENNFRESKDVGDILAVVEGRPELIEEVSSASDKAKSFIKAQMKNLRDQSDLFEILEWQMLERSRDAIVIERLDSISNA